MQHILLLGAGFSRNWGGWLANELTDDLLGRVADDRDLLKRLRKSKTGFEYVLEEVRQQYRRSRLPPYEVRLHKLQEAIIDAFREMNAAFEEKGTLEFHDDPGFSIQNFLARFDAIFTLNQDLLLERLYKEENIACVDGGRWNGWFLPGISYVGKEENEDWWIPSSDVELHPELDLEVAPGKQPVFKLHGSSNWYEINDAERRIGNILIMGGNKAADIQQRQVLKKYGDIFRNTLCRKDTRLMVIGYSFADEHINKVIIDAQEHGLETFIIDPRGTQVLETLNRTRDPTQPAAIQVVEPIEDITVIGVSRRSLRETFGGDTLEFRKVMRFFRPG